MGRFGYREKSVSSGLCSYCSVTVQLLTRAFSLSNLNVDSLFRCRELFALAVSFVAVIHGFRIFWVNGASRLANNADGNEPKHDVSGQYR